MQEKRSKILGTFLFLVLISGLIYLIFFSTRKTNKGEIRMIQVTGNSLLSEGDYLNFTKLNDQTHYNEITLPVIKSRFEKHPYVEKADVEYLSGNIAKVVLTEKKIEAVILFNGEPDFITENFEILPVLANTKFMDLPVISNPKITNKIKPFSIYKDDDIVQAFEIIEAAKLTNESIAKKLSEINLRNGGEIILSFSGVKPPVLFGRSEAAKKMVYLDIMWNGIVEGNSLVENSDYIDLRFANEIYIGAAEKTGLSE